MKLKCDKCGAEFELDAFPEEDFKCPECKADDGTFSLME